MAANLTQTTTQTRLRAVFLYLAEKLIITEQHRWYSCRDYFTHTCPYNTFSTGTGTVKGIEAESSGQRTPFAVTGRAQHDTVSTVYEKRCP